MGYYMAGQLRTIRSSVICKNKSRIGDMTVRRVLMIPCKIFWRIQLKGISIIDFLGINRGGINGHGNAIWLL